jgi:hypothetical protein
MRAAEMVTEPKNVRISFPSHIGIGRAPLGRPWPNRVLPDERLKRSRKSSAG